MDIDNLLIQSESKVNTLKEQKYTRFQTFFHTGKNKIKQKDLRSQSENPDLILETKRSVIDS